MMNTPAGGRPPQSPPPGTRHNAGTLLSPIGGAPRRLINPRPPASARVLGCSPAGFLDPQPSAPGPLQQPRQQHMSAFRRLLSPGRLRNLRPRGEGPKGGFFGEGHHEPGEARWPLPAGVPALATGPQALTTLGEPSQGATSLGRPLPRRGRRASGRRGRHPGERAAGRRWRTAGHVMQ